MSDPTVEEIRARRAAYGSGTHAAVTALLAHAPGDIAYLLGLVERQRDVIAALETQPCHMSHCELAEWRQ